MNTTIIYNPNSTGDSQKNAEAVFARLNDSRDVSLVATKSAGHAEQLARQIADRNDTAMIISSSGDGGYHEIINGVYLSAHSDNIIVGLLPSGNANDHYRALHRGDVVTRINQLDVDAIDLIKVSTDDFTRYAHSYVGFGVTARIGSQLNKTRLNRLKEIWLVARHLFDFTPVKIRYNGKIYRYDNLLFTNIGEMSKVLKITQQAQWNDGKFEITSKRAGNALGLFRQLIKAATIGLDQTRQAESISFTMMSNTKIQLDGEIYDLAAGQTVTIACQHKALRCII